MRSLFTGLVAVLLTASFAPSLLAQQAQVAADPAAQKAIQARNQQLEAVAKGDRRAIEADSKLKAETERLVPTLVANAKASCTPTASLNRAAFGRNVLVEVACQEGVGYLFVAQPDGTNAQAQECIPSATAPLPTACTLPANVPAHKGLQPFVTKAGSDCQVANANVLAASPNLVAYEVACTSGVGQLLTVSLPRGADSRVAAAPCLAVGTVMQGLACSLTTAEANWAPIKALVGQSGRACTPTNQRHVGSFTNGGEYYEFACSDGSGFMIEADAKNAFRRVVPCIQATGIGGGCTLTDTAAAVASQNQAFTTLVKNAGYDCEVTKFANFAPRDGAQAVEMQCGNQPLSFIGVTRDGSTEVMNCFRSQVEGYRCSFSKPEDSYKIMTSVLKAAGPQTCEVSGARPMGSSPTTGMAFIEVACADGARGYVLSFPKGSSKAERATPCVQATSLGGGCQMPENTRQLNG